MGQCTLKNKSVAPGACYIYFACPSFYLGQFTFENKSAAPVHVKYTLHAPLAIWDSVLLKINLQHLVRVKYTLHVPLSTQRPLNCPGLHCGKITNEVFLSFQPARPLLVRQLGYRKKQACTAFAHNQRIYISDRRDSTGHRLTKM